MIQTMRLNFNSELWLTEVFRELEVALPAENNCHHFMHLEDGALIITIKRGERFLNAKLSSADFEKQPDRIAQEIATMVDKFLQHYPSKP